jgi:hypothetical protein
VRAALAATLIIIGACGSEASQGDVDASMTGHPDAATQASGGDARDQSDVDSSTPDERDAAMQASGGDAGDPDAATQASGADASDPWRVLVERAWQQAPNTEAWYCRRIQVTEDTYIGAFRAEAPTGTHHAIATMSPTASKMGDYNCGPLDTDSLMLFAGGVGMEDLSFPAGVAIKVPAGWYVNLNVHVDNRRSTAAAATSGVLIKTVAAATVQHEADMVFLGNIESSAANEIAPMSQKVILGQCNSTSDWHIVGLIPHMHDIGVEQTIKILNPDLSQGPTLLTATYNLDAQHSYPMDVTVPVNHTFVTSCKYVNPSASKTYRLGDSAYSVEQCLAGMYRWPKQTDANADKYSCVTKP